MRRWHPYTLRVQGGHLIRSFHLRHTIRHFSSQPKQILDVGCGSGRDALYLGSAFPEAQLTGIDINAEDIQRAERRCRRYRLPNVSFRCADLLQFGEGVRYDLIYAIEVLEHLPEPEVVLRRLGKLLTPDGLLVIHTPLRHQRRHWRRFDHRTQADHAHEGFDTRVLRNAFGAAGLAILDERYTFGRFGSLAWELFELVRDYGGLVKRWTMPAVLVLGLLDVHTQNRWGNNVLLVARRDE